MTLQDAGGQGVGFLLGSLGVRWALTSEACFKGLPKTGNGDVVTFKGNSVVEGPLVMRWVVGSILHNSLIELFHIPASVLIWWI